MKRSIITLPDENFTKIQNIVIEQKKSGDRKASMNRIMNEAIEFYLKDKEKVYVPHPSLEKWKEKQRDRDKKFKLEKGDKG